MKKIFILLLITCLFIPTSNCFAETLNIDILNILSKNDSYDIINENDIEKLKISDFKETKNFYYLLISNYRQYKGLAILKVNKSNIEKIECISIYNNIILNNYSIHSIYSDKEDNIWAYLYNDIGGKFCKFSESGEIEFISFDNSNTVIRFADDMISYYDNDTKNLMIWDGSKVEATEIKNEILDYTLYENDIYYTNSTGNVYKFNKNENNIIFNIYDYLKLDEKKDKIEEIKLLNLGKKLWFTAGITNHSEAMIKNSGFINITDKLIYDEVSVSNIIKYHENSDGSLYFLMQPYFPPMPNSPIDFKIKNHEILIKEGLSTVITSDLYHEEITQKYIGNDFNVFTYNLMGNTNGITKKITDDTTINYYFKSLNNDKNTVKVKCNNTYISFDTNPYIENGRTMVPIRGLMYILEGRSEWNNGIVNIEVQDKKISLEIGSYIAYVNGVPIKLDAPVKIVNGRTMVPLRFITENFSIDVDWDAENYEVIIYKDLKF